MKTGHNPDTPSANNANKNLPSLRRWTQIIACLIGVLSVATLVSIFLSARLPKPSPDAQTGEPAEQQNSETATTPSHPAGPAGQPAMHQPAQPMYSAFQVAPSAGSRQLVNSLVNPESSISEWTDEQKAAWKQRLQQLIQQGAEAVPAIREFLAKNLDLEFGPDGPRVLGYTSARAAMIDALAQIGGPLAEAAMTDVLHSTADPHEIAILAQNLQNLDPGVHQQEAVDSARQALTMAAQGGLPGKDVAPLFELFQKFGGANVVPELEGAAKTWGFYAMNALARLPDGVGVPALAQLADGAAATSSDARAPALQMLAQVATQYDDARSALVGLARQNQLTAYDWLVLAPYLAGDQLILQNAAFDSSSAVNPNDLKATHISGNQNFYTAPLGAMTIDQIDQRKALIDELLSATSNPDAIQTLQKAESQLSQRLSQIAATK
jgi:hypothetical protein